MIHVFFLLIYTFFFSISNCNDFSDYKTYKKSKINLVVKLILTFEKVFKVCNFY